MAWKIACTREGSETLPRTQNFRHRRGSECLNTAIEHSLPRRCQNLGRLRARRKHRGEKIFRARRLRGGGSRKATYAMKTKVLRDSLALTSCHGQPSMEQLFRRLSEPFRCRNDVGTGPQEMGAIVRRSGAKKIAGVEKNHGFLSSGHKSLAIILEGFSTC